MAKSSVKNQEQSETQPEEKAISTPVPEVRKEKFIRIKPHAKARPDDEESAVVSVNGEILVMERQKECVIPERFVVALQNARGPVFRQMPGESRKIVGEVMTFPFDNLGEGTEEEYLTMRREGTKIAREAMANTTLKS